jgi:hypothetical protein
MDFLFSASFAAFKIYMLLSNGLKLFQRQSVFTPIAENFQAFLQRKSRNFRSGS